MQRRRVRMLTITRKALPQIGQPCISPVLLNQPREIDLAATLAAMATDLEGRARPAARRG